MQAMYAFSVGDQSLEHVLQTIIVPSFREDPAGLEFAEKLFLRTADNQEKTEEIIQDHIANWEIERLAVVDRIILQMAISEIMAFQDIPAKVTINEAIEIAKKYSTSRSGHFVNGILDAVLLTLKEKGDLQKQGRGLVDQPARNRKKKPGVQSIPTETGNIDPEKTDIDNPPEPSVDSDRSERKPLRKRRKKRSENSRDE